MKKMFKSLLAFILPVMLLLSISEKAKATHAMGSDLTYRYIGPGPTPGSSNYEITFTFYRDCVGIPVSTFTGSLDVTNSCGYPAFTVNLSFPPDTPIVTPACSTEITSCEGGIYIGAHEWVFRDVITLPGECVDWTFSHAENARNNSITSLEPPGGGVLYVFATLNNTNGLTNNSPTFSKKPVPFACVGQRFCFNHGAYDVDGDSLVYELITPRTGPNPADTVDFDSLHSATQPVISNPPMTFNTANGDFCMNPTQPEITILAVLINEYRNGVLIGQVERDIQVSILPCNNILPTLSGINGTPVFNRTICAGSQLCFGLYTRDPNTDDSTTISWAIAIPGATLSHVPGRLDSVVFCWTPTLADVRPSPHYFHLTVTDNNCPYAGQNTYAFGLTVKGLVPNAGPDQTIPCGAVTDLVASATGGDGTYTYMWSPSGSNATTLSNVGIGTYYLTATSAGCSYRDTVRILPGLGVPVANFGFSNNCSGQPVPFIDSSTVTGSTINSWSWNFGDGNTDTAQNPSHLYANNGTYDVSLVVSTPLGCTDTLTQQVTINTNIPTAQFVAPGVCEGTLMTFADNSLGGPFNSWSWNFNDPASSIDTSTLQNPTFTFGSSGTYSVDLTVVNSAGCQNQIQQVVTVFPNPVIVVNDAGMCENTQATLNGPAGYSQYSWDNGQTTQSITVSPLSTQNFILTVTDINGCTGNDTAAVNVDPIPTANAGIDDTICEGTNANLSGMGGVLYTWNPGNITGQNIVVNPSSSTVYTLTAELNSGCKDDDYILVNVNPMPAAIIDNINGICEGESIEINSTVGVGTILWTPGNFNASTINVTPALTTTYYLLVSDAIGCSGTDSVTVVVNPIPVAIFSNPLPGCGNNLILFDDTSTISAGYITGWNWDFGNGQTSNLQNPLNSYITPGDFNVRLIITSDAGCKDSAYSIQTIWASPVAAYTHTNECEGIPISFNDASTISDNSPLNYSWAFGDNSTASGPSILHQYNVYGSYTATLYATSVNGCLDSITKVVNVYAFPQAAFKADYACENQPALFLDLSTIPQGVINSWYWAFESNNISTEQNPTYVYSDDGDYDVKMLISSEHGCKDSTNQILRVAPGPIVDFTSQNVCLGDTVTFIENTQPVTGSIVQYQWSFGDGNVSSDQNPIHVYNTSGWFDVSLTATSDSGCHTSLTRPKALNIFPLPEVYFMSNASIADEIYPEVTFVNQTLSAAFFYWNFGDSDTSTEFSPVHLYGDVGHYDVQLIAIDMNGCIDSTLIRLEIKPTSNVFVPNAFTPNGDTKNDYFQIYSYNVIDMDVQIYDRWGIKIIEWNGAKGRWDGRIDGTPVQADTYVYRVSTLDVNSKREVRVGHVSLVR